MNELATATVCAGLETFGAVIAPGETDNRPIPEPDELDAKVSAVFQVANTLFADSPLEGDGQSFLWGLVNAYHAQIKRLERAIDANIQKQRALMASYDGSTVDDDTIIEETARGHALVEREEALTVMFDAAAQEFQTATGCVWQPRYGSRAKAPHFPQSFLEASDFERERAKTYSEQNLPPGPYIVFAGGVDFQAVKTIWDRLDAALRHQPNMVLLHAGSRGACMIASKWAESRGVTQIKYSLRKRHKDDRQAGFQRNERMLRTRPIGVIAFPGNGVDEQLKRRAAELAIKVWDYEKHLAKCRISDPDDADEAKNGPATTSAEKIEASDNTPAPTKPEEVLAEFGPHLVAKHVGVTPDTVKRWNKKGIPASRVDEIMSLAA